MSPLEGFAESCGWISFVLWSVSFWPQIVENHKRRSVVGYSLDYLAMNILGFICYAVYTCMLYFDKDIQDQYHSEYGSGSIPVQPNDVAFALHAIFCLFIIAFQCLIFERGEQKVANMSWGIIGLGLLYVAILAILALAHVFSWFRMLELMSFVKLGMSFIKYVPQAYQNFMRKSTVGWNIHNVFLDFFGGLFSLLQQICLSVDQDDWNQLYGNPAKFGLALESMFFDLIFLFQHYVLYTDRSDVYARFEPTSAVQESTSRFSSVDEKSQLLA
eukprot:ANDGO_03718.mRNA.1 Cystinosin homolog